MANIKSSTQNNINVYNKNKVSELKTIQKFLNAMFPVSTASSTIKKTTSTKAKKSATTTNTHTDSSAESQVQ